VRSGIHHEEEEGSVKTREMRQDRAELDKRFTVSRSSIADQDNPSSLTFYSEREAKLSRLLKSFQCHPASTGDNLSFA
jgi:hypothetical protein